MLAGYWKTTRLSTRVHVSYNLSAGFYFQEIPNQEPTHLGIRILDTLEIPYWQGISFQKLNTLLIPWCKLSLLLGSVIFSSKRLHPFRVSFFCHILKTLNHKSLSHVLFSFAFGNVFLLVIGIDCCVWLQ